ncbi:MAG: POTRA domain-containing protein, partial [Sneathiella sp.]
MLLAVFAFATLSTMLTGSQPAFAQSSVIISEVRVEGNQRIEADTVRSYLLVTAGTPYDRSRVDRSLK